MTVFPLLNVNTLNLKNKISVTKIVMGFINSFTYVLFYMKTRDATYPVETSFKRNLLHLSHLYPEEGRTRCLQKLVNIYRHTWRHIP